ncbi:endoplasmic reticulum protein [Mycena belliarum]|uniref:ER membrane protein complex subunit 4 n=1 Tax=Mycena belliarum TaxID=1033014 RepID=A0AAD6XPW4_9AGAR|nr:endoplasmic reticulum protein [Mycena belliae]
MSKTLEYSTLETASKWRNLPPPPGFSKTASVHFTSSTPTHTAPPPEAYNQLKEKRALEFATAPAKSLPMQAFMLYMSGGGVQIFSMGIVFMLLLTPFKNLAGMNDAFAQFAPSTATNPRAFTTLALQKLIYVACNIITLMVGLWKCRSMGLLPLGTGDWLAFETRGLAPEMALF